MKALVGYVALTVLFTFPLSIHPGRLQRLGPDGNLFIWTIAWDAHAFVHQPLAIFDANIYFPGAAHARVLREPDRQRDHGAPRALG